MTGGPRPRGRTAMAVVATTAEVLAHPELHEGLLASWELRRLARTRLPGRRDDVLAARLLLRLCVARYTVRPLREAAPAQYCADCGGSGHGRPYLPAHPGVGVSLSHTDGLVAAAVGPGAVGVDVEPAARRPGPLSVLSRLLPEAGIREATARPDPGAALLRLWVRREALLKAGQEDVRLLEWTDRRRAAVVTVASAAPATTFTVGPRNSLSVPSGPQPESRSDGGT
ncbi:4'-phosphopantetheinyl transferase family protein [Streptomyces uncialis]|uniref:4'-phosphopantetheinyl transferase family protein n=1 Tax=Streptomyces uncialis TaxID=1048205 RepID=UPI00225BE502|nr:4'-phosphopantetheinyl transferase superfamily protein [Streptomyces uncialis]MCX4661957.1 4'-phosphopantetheinyl transferase superfamily protein [Streptomyces uncialis]